MYSLSINDEEMVNMAKIEDLQASIAKAAEKVEKIKGTIAKHEAAAAKKLEALAKLGVTLENMQEQYGNAPRDNAGYALRSAISEYEGKMDDAKGAQRKLRDAEAVLKGWQAKLDVELEKERFVSNNAPAVIIEFLNQWKEMARDWHIQGCARYLELKPIIESLKAEAKEAYRAAFPGGREWGKEYDKFMAGQKELRNAQHAQAIFGSVVATMATYRNEMERLAYLEGVLEADRKAKMFNLITQVNEVVGKITDASYLRVNEKGNLDGIVYGEKGKARVTTIGVGGYNIVCFHYRTNVYATTEEPRAEEAPIAAAVEEAEEGQAAFLLEDMVNPVTVGKLGKQLEMNF